VNGLTSTRGVCGKVWKGEGRVVGTEAAVAWVLLADMAGREEDVLLGYKTLHARCWCSPSRPSCPTTAHTWRYGVTMTTLRDSG